MRTLVSALNSINVTLALRRDSLCFNIFGTILAELGQIQNAKKAFSKASKLRKSEAENSNAHAILNYTHFYAGVYNRTLAYLEEDAEKAKLVI